MVSSPLVSVIMIADRQQSCLPTAIQSVLDQTHSNLELMVVEPPSPGDAAQVISQFADSRIKHVVDNAHHDSATLRNLGIRVSDGELIAFLDIEDRYHPERLKAHVDLLARNPEIDLTYNSHIELDSAGHNIGIWRPPQTVTCSELPLGFPLTINDIVVRKKCLERVESTDDHELSFSETPGIIYRMALAGCQGAGLSRALSYHRRWSGAQGHDLTPTFDDTIQALETLLDHPLCPELALPLREKILGGIYLRASYLAFVRGETSLGQSLIRKSIRYDRSILDMQAKNYLQFLVSIAVSDGEYHEKRVHQLVQQLPAELAWISQFRERTIANSYLDKGVRAVIWGRPEQGHRDLTKAAAFGAVLDRDYLGTLLTLISDYDEEFGFASTADVVQELCRHIRVVGKGSDIRWFAGLYFISRAFSDYHRGQYGTVPTAVKKAISANPLHMLNRGVLSIFFRSSLKPELKGASTAG